MYEIVGCQIVPLQVFLNDLTFMKTEILLCTVDSCRWSTSDGKYCSLQVNRQASTDYTRDESNEWMLCVVTAVGDRQKQQKSLMSH